MNRHVSGTKRMLGAGLPFPVLASEVSEGSKGERSEPFGVLARVAPATTRSRPARIILGV